MARCVGVGRSEGGGGLDGISGTGLDVALGDCDGGLLVRAWVARLAMALGRNVAGERLGRATTRLAASGVSRGETLLTEDGGGVSRATWPRAEGGGGGTAAVP